MNSSWQGAVGIMTAWLLLSKVPDFRTTWLGLRRSSPEHEQNRLARTLFMKVGFGPGMVAIAALYAGIVLITAWQLLVLPVSWRWPCGSATFATALLVGVVNLQVARVNADRLAGKSPRGRHPWPLGMILTLAGRLYGPRA